MYLFNALAGDELHNEAKFALFPEGIVLRRRNGDLNSLASIAAFVRRMVRGATEERQAA